MERGCQINYTKRQNSLKLTALINILFSMDQLTNLY